MPLGFLVLKKNQKETEMTAKHSETKIQTHVTWKCHAQVRQQRPESPTTTLAWQVCKYKLHKLHQRHILRFFIILFRIYLLCFRFIMFLFSVRLSSVVRSPFWTVSSPPSSTAAMFLCRPPVDTCGQYQLKTPRSCEMQSEKRAHLHTHT